MRVLFVNRYYYPDQSATSQMLTDLTKDLHQTGMDITVITGRQLIDKPQAALAVHEWLDGIDVYRAWSTHFGREKLVGRGIDYLSFYFGAGWLLLSLCRSGDVVVAKTDPPLISVVAGLVARMRGALLVNWLHDLFPEIAERLEMPFVRGYLARALCGLRNHSLRRARCNVVIGARMAEQVTALGDSWWSIRETWVMRTSSIRSSMRRTDYETAPTSYSCSSVVACSVSASSGRRTIGDSRTCSLNPTNPGRP
jgi:hypothetical protein